jgi:hypothetical protein
MIKKSDRDNEESSNVVMTAKKFVDLISRKGHRLSVKASQNSQVQFARPRTFTRRDVSGAEND